MILLSWIGFAGLLILGLPMLLRQREVESSEPRVIARIQSPYQDIVLSGEEPDIRLYIDGDLQLSTLDEYRYHESLVHPAISAHQFLRQKINESNRSEDGCRVLLLGAGDGMALREVLKWSNVNRVVLIDLDAAVIELAQQNSTLSQINQNSFADSRVEIKIADALVELPAMTELFDVIIADFPDPHNVAIAELYTTEFYQCIIAHLSSSGVFVTQSSSAFYAPKVQSCITQTLQSIELQAYPYVTDVPSFGSWGFVLASRQPLNLADLPLPIPTRFLTSTVLQHLFDLPKDMQLQPVAINQSSNLAIAEYACDERWSFYQRADLDTED